ncbi:MAG: nicotinamidase [Cellvibrionaceae bacterium]|nr:nicotinamidase [Cellvibrionaceae bacterium]|tara:strand:- start:19989 stop:20609 length:621 start_codon:yes stop_codon:yes gene_type:complete
MNISKEFTASFDVDPQKGFTPICPNELPVPKGDEIAAPLNEQAKMARIRVVSKDAHPATATWRATEAKPQFSEVDGDNMDIRWNIHCVPGTQGFELLDDLPKVNDYDFAVYKGIEPDMHPYGACYHDLASTKSTGVVEYLKSEGITTVIVGGLATDYCVKTTAIQLREAGFEVIVNLAACRGIDFNTVKDAIKEMKATGVNVLDSL